MINIFVKQYLLASDLKIKRKIILCFCLKWGNERIVNPKGCALQNCLWSRHLFPVFVYISVELKNILCDSIHWETKTFSIWPEYEYTIRFHYGLREKERSLSYFVCQCHSLPVLTLQWELLRKGQHKRTN